MASVRTRGKKKTWYALYRDADGKLVQKALKATSKRQAEEMAEDLEKASRPTAGQATVERMRDLLNDLYKRTAGKEMPRMTAKAFCDYWLKLRSTEISVEAQAVYKNALKLFVEHLGPRADRDLFEVTRHDIVTFRDSLLLTKSATTVNGRMKILRMMFKAAAADKWIPDNPTVEVKAAKKSYGRQMVKRRDFTPDELRRVIRACPDDEWRGIVIRSYYTGQRLKDICLMLAGQEDPMAQRVHFKTSKTGKVVILQMHPAYVDWVLSQSALDNPKAPLHPRAYKSVMERVEAGKSGATVTVSGAFRRILEAAGLREKESHVKKEGGPGRKGRRRGNDLVFHGLRHSFVSHLAAAGVSAAIVRDMVGQDSERVNQGYTHIDHDTKGAAIKKLPNILKDG